MGGGAGGGGSANVDRELIHRVLYFILKLFD